MEVEPGSGKSLPEIKTKIHDGANTSPLGRYQAHDYQNGCL